MGWSLSWAATKNGTIETVCTALNLRPTGEREEIAESKIDTVQIPTGWQVVVWNRHEVEDQVLAKLSEDSDVVSCFVEDHVMFSSASGWARGKQVWKVFHDCEKGRYHLDVVGAAPAGLASIRKRLTDAQDANGGEEGDADYIYDIPAELTKALTGFRHDEDMPGVTGDAFRVLAPAGGSKASLATKFMSMFGGNKR
ncbi:MAG TPA: hypothetical protein VFN26_01060 [Candidatus Acidoferrum sp.]|nr:hypothetical protein [Candidatus Acidoferrum sp.]